VLIPEPPEGDEGLPGTVAGGEALDVALDALALQRRDGGKGLGELVVEEVGGDAVDEPVQHAVEGEEGVEGIADTVPDGADDETELKSKVTLLTGCDGCGGEAIHVWLGEPGAVASVTQGVEIASWRAGATRSKLLVTMGAAAGVIAVLLPGVPLVHHLPRAADARRFMRRGVAVALREPVPAAPAD